MSEDKEIIDLDEKCKIEYTKDGNIKIVGDCNGKGFNRTEIKLFDRVSDIIEEEAKKIFNKVTDTIEASKNED